MNNKLFKKILLAAVVLSVGCIVIVPCDGQAKEAGYIDTHVHLDGLYRSRGKIVKDYEMAAENLITQMDRLGVAKALVMPPPQVPEQTMPPDYQDLLNSVKKYSDRLFLVAGGKTLNSLIHGTDPAAVSQAIRDQFEMQAERLIQAGAKGFGEMTALHLSFSDHHVFEEVSPDHLLFLLLADIAARHNIPIDLHTEAVPHQIELPPGFERISQNNPPVLQATLPGLERLLAHNRNARIVWQHIGWDNTGYMTIELLRQLLDTYPNLYLSFKLVERPSKAGGEPSGLTPIVDENWRIRPEWSQFISHFPDRFMIGSDQFFGIPGQTPPRPQSFEKTWSVLDQLPSELARQVGHDNAARIYNLD